MNQPLVSVVIPAYNCANTIAEAIESALIQNVPMEIIVVNDCSPDNLDEVMAQYASIPFLRYIKNEVNMGAAESRNRGITVAQGEYIAFLDGDDYWLAGKLQRQLELMERTGTVLCSTARELMNPDGTLLGKILPVKSEVTYRALLFNNSINCSSVLIRTSVAREFPMRHSDSHEDYITWLQVLRKYGKASGINEPLLKYRVSANSKSGSKWKSAKMTFAAYRYLGFGWIKSFICFCGYAYNGVKKYYFNPK